MCGPLVEFCGDCRAIALDAGCFRAAIVTGASKGIGAAIAKGSDAGACEGSGLNITPTRARRGAISLSKPGHLPPTENSNMLKPVRLPPGLAMVATKP